MGGNKEKKKKNKREATHLFDISFSVSSSYLTSILCSCIRGGGEGLQRGCRSRGRTLVTSWPGRALENSNAQVAKRYLVFDVRELVQGMLRKCQGSWRWR